MTITTATRNIMSAAPARTTADSRRNNEEVSKGQFKRSSRTEMERWQTTLSLGYADRRTTVMLGVSRLRCRRNRLTLQPAFPCFFFPF